jgi:hypothetical protein
MLSMSADSCANARRRLLPSWASCVVSFFKSAEKNGDIRKASLSCRWRWAVICPTHLLACPLLKRGHLCWNYWPVHLSNVPVWTSFVLPACSSFGVQWTEPPSAVRRGGLVQPYWLPAESSFSFQQFRAYSVSSRPIWRVNWRPFLVILGNCYRRFHWPML